MKDRHDRRKKAGPDRQKQETTRPLWPLLALVFCLALLTASLAGLFQVHTVKVVGIGLSKQSVVQEADISGANIFTLRSDDLIARVDAAGQVAVQRVSISLPDQVTIYAQARRPMVAWQNGHRLYEVDIEGNIIRQINSTTLPIVTGASGQTRLGSDVVQAVKYAVQVLPGAPSGNLAAFRFEKRTGLTIEGRSGWTAIVGSGTPQTLVDRIGTLASFLRKISDRAAALKIVDLRYRVPYARFTGS